jgi:hypothetical protein
MLGFFLVLVFNAEDGGDMSFVEIHGVISQKTELFVRRMFRSRRVDVTGSGRTLHIDKLHILYSSSNISATQSRRMRLAWRVARMFEMRSGYTVLVEKPEGMQAVGRPRLRLAYKIKMDLKETF